MIKILVCVAILLAFSGASTAQSQIPEDLKITIQRSVCYGSCPDYTLTVLADGTVQFDGRANVATKGVAYGHASYQDLQKLVSAFEAASYFTLHDQYRAETDGCPEVWTDNPTVVTSILISGKSKTILHYHGCQAGSGSSVFPTALTELETTIDRILGSSQWVKDAKAEKDPQ